jgi:hypothetical protein
LSADLVDAPHPQSSAILRGLHGLLFEAELIPKNACVDCGGPDCPILPTPPDVISQ